MMELHQRALFEKRSYYLEEDKLRTFVKDADGETENYLDYEEFSSRTRLHMERNSRLFMVTVSFWAFAILGLVYGMATGSQVRHVGFWLLMALVLGAFYLMTKKRYILLDMDVGRSLFFLRNSPDQATVREFIDRIIKKKQQGLRDKYFYVNRDADRDREEARLKWLLKEDIITDEEYQYSIHQLDSDDVSYQQ